MADRQQLPLLAEKILTSTYEPHLVSYECRTELLAVVNDQDDIDIYRLGGQHVLTHKRKSNDPVTCLRWTSNGRLELKVLVLRCSQSIQGPPLLLAQPRESWKFLTVSEP